ncbi:MAG TPA: C40 family peptidase [Chlamydiales bacterium]|nr:C40 family peptidase [Chlamydiales bacterium]
MRKTPVRDAEIVSQVLFAEKVTLIQELESDSLIRTADGYEGWVYSDALISELYQPTMVTCRLSVPVYHQQSILYAPLFYLPYGVEIRVIESDSRWHTIELPSKEICYIQRGNLIFHHKLNKEDLLPFCFQFLGIPYLWGGRSSIGSDCSGFSQMIYFKMGIQIPRDSLPQSQDSRFQEVEHPQLGDLIFWGESRETISHVAVSLGNDQFIHASTKEQQPWIRISRLSDSVWNCGPNAAYPFRFFRTLLVD